MPARAVECASREKEFYIGEEIVFNGPESRGWKAMLTRIDAFTGEGKKKRK